MSGRKTGGFVLSHQVFVEADGYVPVPVALTDLVGGSNWPLSRKVFKVKLTLFKINRADEQAHSTQRGEVGSFSH